VYCLDGGLSDFQPVIDDDTITVSPFYFSDCDIRPSRYVPFWWGLVPPKSTETIDWLYNLGWEDAMAFIDSKSLGGLESPHARPHIEPVTRRRHSYDVRKRVSMHRFLGYDISDLTHHSVGFVLDLLLLVLFVVLWKPLSILLIYSELIVRSAADIFIIVLRELLVILPYTLASLLLFSLNPAICTSYSLAILCTKLSVFGVSQSSRKSLANVADNLLCLFSLSLFLRFFSFYPSKEPLRKHTRLQRASLLYRIFHHIM
jgi:hypothetical protein